MTQSLQPYHSDSCLSLHNDARLRYLEQLLLMVSVLGLVLKSTFQEYVLERIQPVSDQLELFKDDSIEFKSVKSLFNPQWSAECLLCECRGKPLQHVASERSSVLGTTQSHTHSPLYYNYASNLNPAQHHKL
jgi:hypothetical protein